MSRGRETFRLSFVPGISGFCGSDDLLDFLRNLLDTLSALLVHKRLQLDKDNPGQLNLHQDRRSPKIVSGPFAGGLRGDEEVSPLISTYEKEICFTIRHHRPPQPWRRRVS